MDALKGDGLGEGQEGDRRTPWRTFMDVDFVRGDPVGALHLRSHLLQGDGVAGAARGQVFVYAVGRAIVAENQPRVVNVNRPTVGRAGWLHAMIGCNCKLAFKVLKVD